MKLESMPLTAIDWARVAPTTAAGATGSVTMRSQQLGPAQLRIVEYGPGYLADHWCSKGHVVHVLAGALVLEHQDGRSFPLVAGMSYTVSDDDGAPHRVKSEHGATVFIVD
jgi:hypothetical protein